MVPEERTAKLSLLPFLRVFVAVVDVATINNLDLLMENVKVIQIKMDDNTGPSPYLY